MAMEIPKQNYILAQLDEIEPVRCPCGNARRAFGDDKDGVATIHLVDISKNMIEISQTTSDSHFHRRNGHQILIPTSSHYHRTDTGQRKDSTKPKEIMQSNFAVTAL